MLTTPENLEFGVFGSTRLDGESGGAPALIMGTKVLPEITGNAFELEGSAKIVSSGMPIVTKREGVNLMNKPQKVRN